MRMRSAVFVLFAWTVLCAADVAAQTATPAETKPRPTAEQARAFVQSLLVKSPYRMSAQARAGEIRYRLRFESSREWAWPETGEQRATIDANGAELRICSDCGREQAPTDAELRRYLAPNAWVQSDHRRIRNFARQHTRSGSTNTRMQALVAAIQKHMTGAIDYRDYHDALTALETRSGDCTEYAVLLAASARALGIPARLAHGIAYSSRFTGQAHVFSPHVWVQVWDGTRWTSYDAGLGRFDAGHLALYIGDGSPDGLSGLGRVIRDLQIEEAAGILHAPAATAAAAAIGN